MPVYAAKVRRLARLVAPLTACECLGALGGSEGQEKQGKVTVAETRSPYHGAGPASPARRIQRNGFAVSLTKPFWCAARSSGVLRDGVAHAVAVAAGIEA